MLALAAGSTQALDSRAITAMTTSSNTPASVDVDLHDNVDPPATSAFPRESHGRRRAPKRSFGPWIMVAVIMGVAVVIGSTFKPGQGALVYSKYVDEVMAEPARYQAQGEVRVEGIVQAGSVQNQRGSREFRFRVERNGRSMPVHYVGIVPDTFREGIGVTVRGRLLPSGEFEAREVVAKCPSKYEMRAAQQRGQRMPWGVPTAQ